MRCLFARQILAAIAGILAWAVASSVALPQDYPARPIRVIIPLGPGGGGDVFTRALADELQKAWGQPVVVENRPGGALNIGTRACAEAAPDGCTICVLSSEPVVYNQLLFKSLPFDPNKDLQPIVNLFIAEIRNGEEYPSTWFGLFAPAGTPPPIIAKLADEVTRIVSAPDVRQRMFVERGVEPGGARLDDYRRFIREERKMAAQIVKDSGQQPE
jgi:tripartite-type tricarboxylate transporter receptor subunit TctC